MITYELRRKVRIGIGIILMVTAPALPALRKYEYIPTENEMAVVVETLLFMIGIIIIWSTIRNKKYSVEHGEVYRAAAANDIKHLRWLIRQGVDISGDQGKKALKMLVNDYIADPKYNNVVQLLLINGARLDDIYNIDYYGIFTDFRQSSGQKWFSEEHFKKYVNYYSMLLKYHDDKFNERVIAYLRSGDRYCVKLLEALIMHDDHLAKILNRLSSSER